MIIDMREETKEKICVALAVLGFTVGCVTIIELLRWFLWACYEAGLQM